MSAAGGLSRPTTPGMRVRGLDAIDGTPVLDIKPVMKGFLPRGDGKAPTKVVRIVEITD